MPDFEICDRVRVRDDVDLWPGRDGTVVDVDDRRGVLITAHSYTDQAMWFDPKELDHA